MNKRRFRDSKELPAASYPTLEQAGRFALLGLVGAGAVAAAGLVSAARADDPSVMTRGEPAYTAPLPDAGAPGRDASIAPPPEHPNYAAGGPRPMRPATPFPPDAGARKR
jgi:hypothetical protein